jgi:hypothetical protein
MLTTWRLVIGIAAHGDGSWLARPPTAILSFALAWRWRQALRDVCKTSPKNRPENGFGGP